MPFFLEGGNRGDVSVVSGKEDAVPLRWAGRCGGDWPRCGVHVCDCAHARSRGVSPMPLCQGTSRNQQEGEPGSSRQDQAGRRPPGHCPQPPGRLSGVGLGGGAEARSSGRPAGADRLLPLPACSFSGHSGPAPQAPPLAQLCLPANLCRAGPRRGPCAVSPFPKSHGTPQRARKQGLPRGCSPLSPPNTGDAGQAGPPSGQRRCPVDRSAADKPAAMGEGAGPGSGAWGRPGPATALGRVVTPGLVSTQTGDGDQVGK